MAAVARQPFAPLDGARLKGLTSLKNRQNSIAVSSPGKRKAADLLDLDDFENVDPAILLSKRSKANSSDPYGKDFFKPSSLFLTKSSSTPAFSSSKDGLSSSLFSSPLKATPRPRSILNPKSPAKKLNDSLSRKSRTPMSAPAGRSPTRGNKRIGILNRRRTGPYTRVDPPAFNLFSAPFSLDAAIKGTVPSYAGHSSPPERTASSSSVSLSENLHDPGMKSSWFFDIHEDTPEQEMTNLLQHSTCMLDISSDEECEHKLRRERAEGRGKENIPPADDVSQISVRRNTTTTSEGGMEYEKPRTALGDLNVEDFYADGCDPTTVIIVPGDDDDDDATVVDGEQSQGAQQDPSALSKYTTIDPETSLDAKAAVQEFSEPRESKEPDEIATFLPVEGTDESFELWESSSAKGDGDGARSPSPAPASPASETGNCYDVEC